MTASRPDRRAQLASALESCIREKGYAGSSLTDVAGAAGMSPSHVLYYFDGKAAILDFLFQQMMGDLLEALLANSNKPPMEQIDTVAAIFFGGEQVDSSTSGVYFEIFGAAVHDPRLRATKQRWDRGMLDMFAAIFEESPTNSGMTAQQAATIAFAMLIGLRMNTYFNDDLEIEEARAQLRLTLLRLAGLD